MRLLRGIRGLLYDDGMTIKGVQKILRERGIRHVIGLGTVNGHAEEDGVAAVEAPPAPSPARPIELPVAQVETEESNGHPYPETPVAPDLFDLHDGVALTERPPLAETLPEEHVSPAPVEATAGPAEEAVVEGSEMNVEQDVRPEVEARAAPQDPAERRQALVALVAQLKALREVMARDA